jgi:hypothetical protein
VIQNGVFHGKSKGNELTAWLGYAYFLACTQNMKAVFNTKQQKVQRKANTKSIVGN